MKTGNRVYQFKISLREIEPAIWRRIQVPVKYSFWDLHVAIQDSMGWLDSHLHQFSIKMPQAHKTKEIGIPDEEGYLDIEILAGWDVDISSYFTDLGVTALYKYDFGDSWEHDIILEGLLIKEKGVKYPRCLDGERKCPPEDCGGTDGYFEFLGAVLNPSHEENARMLEWYGSKYEPEEFAPTKVRFDNPKKRWKVAFQDR
jgi:hypothetical protein